MAATPYICFKQTNALDTDGLDEWLVIGNYTASSADAAKQQAAIEHGDGTYSAAPARSWVPRKLTVAARASFAKDAS